MSGSVDSGVGDALSVKGSVDRGRAVFDVLLAEGPRLVVGEFEAIPLHSRSGRLRLLL